MKKLGLTLLMVLACACGYAVDDIVVTDATDGTITTVTYNWTSDGSGNAVGVTTTPLPGVVFSATTQPKSSAQPTNNYDVVVYEQFVNASGGSDAVDSSDDLMDGLLANRNNTVNAVQTVRMIPNTVNTTVGKIRIEVSNAGAAKQGTVTLLVGRGWYIKKGESSIPMTGGSTGQILQYQGPGAAKFVTMSGGATIADGGAVTLGTDFASLNVGGGYGSTGATIAATGNIQTNGTMTVDGVSTLTGNVTATSAVTVGAGFLVEEGIGGDNTLVVGSGEVLIPATATILDVRVETDFGEGYGSTGVTIEPDGDIKANGNLNVGGFLILDTPAAAITIASGAATPIQTRTQLDTQGAAASDDLDTLTATSIADGTIVTLRTTSSSRDVVVKHLTGNIRLDGAADYTIANTASTLTLIYDSTLAVWKEMARSTN